MLRFHKKYFIAAILLFITEVLIAIFAHDQFIRPYFGDYLVVILIYCFLRSFINASPWKVALFTLIFSYIIETLQYFNFVNLVGLQHSRLANIIIGNSFAWTDILMYTLGIITIMGIEFVYKRNSGALSKR